MANSGGQFSRPLAVAGTGASKDRKKQIRQKLGMTI